MTAQTMHQTATDEPSDEQRAAAACRLYDAECALHAAHQAHEDAWVAAASQKLHDAIEAYLAVGAR